jgi:surface antigen
MPTAQHKYTYRPFILAAILVSLLTLTSASAVWAMAPHPTERPPQGTQPPEDGQDYRAQGDEPADRVRRSKYSFRGCTAYVASQRAITWGGHAKSWAANARAQGYPVDTTPAVNAIMVRTSGRCGHVAIVRGVEWAISAQGERALQSITVEEGHYYRYVIGDDGRWASTGVAAGWGEYYAGPPNATLNRTNWRILRGSELAGLQYVHGVGS